jgi:CheY-like chemotaxis protein
MKLKQVMINILGNAVKFTGEGGSVTFNVEQLSETDGVCKLRFVMKDTGIGIDEEYLPKIFDRFSQEDSTNTNKYGGSGLGMAITRNFVAMMNGTVTVDSKKGEGSVFTVTVDLLKSDRSASEDKASDTCYEEGFLAGKRVLMAEDVEQNAEILADILELENVESEHAVNGKEAVRMFTESEEGYYDAILMDVRMPEMDGLTATSLIRRLDRSDAMYIPIIAMTANVFDEDIERSLMAGMNAHLSKPVEPDKLYETMIRLIKESGV